MPTLLQWSESTGCGATVKLDNGDVVHVSIGFARVTVRQWNLCSLVNAVASRFFGPKLYSERSRAWNARTAASLSVMYPDQEPGLPQFKNTLLGVFVNAICHCRSAAEVRAVLNEASSRDAPPQ